MMARRGRELVGELMLGEIVKRKKKAGMWEFDRRVNDLFNQAQVFTNHI